MDECNLVGWLESLDSENVNPILYTSIRDMVARNTNILHGFW